MRSVQKQTSFRRAFSAEEKSSPSRRHQSFSVADRPRLQRHRCAVYLHLHVLDSLIQIVKLVLEPRVIRGDHITSQDYSLNWAAATDTITCFHCLLSSYHGRLHDFVSMSIKRFALRSFLAAESVLSDFV